MTCRGIDVKRLFPNLFREADLDVPPLKLSKSFFPNLQET
jgi:hypothetical protein